MNNHPPAPVSMWQDGQRIEIVISGAVQHAGAHALPVSATVGDALDAAGGFDRSAAMWPSGVLTNRRPQRNGKVAVWTFDVTAPTSSEWRRFQLESGDLVVFQWYIDAAGVGE